MSNLASLVDLIADLKAASNHYGSLQKLAVWEKGRKINNYDPRVWRMDALNRPAQGATNVNCPSQDHHTPEAS